MLDPGGDDDYELEDLEPVALELTVYPTDEDPEPVLFMPDGTPLYRWRPPFGFNLE